MKQYLTIAAIAAPGAALAAYMGEVTIPVLILVAAMVLDLATGIANAWMKREISSEKARKGVIKKSGSIACVGVGAGVDLILLYVGEDLGLTRWIPTSMLFGLLVIIWLVVNEFISILENVRGMGVPVPSFLDKVLLHFKKKAEDAGDGISAGTDKGKGD